MVGTGRFELPTPRTPSECSTRLSHVPTGRSGRECGRWGSTYKFYTTAHRLREFIAPPEAIERLRQTRCTRDPLYDESHVAPTHVRTRARAGSLNLDFCKLLIVR